MTAPPWNRAPGAAGELERLAGDLDRALRHVLSRATIEDRYTNSPGDPVVFISPDPWVWVFGPDALPARRTARRLLDRWLELGQRVLRAAAPETEEEFCERAGALRSPLDLSEAAEGPGARELDKAAGYVLGALAEQRALVRRVLGSELEPGSSELWLIPDTNALYRNPSLEKWANDQPATLVLIPQVVRELAAHKQHHPVEEVRRKAQGLLRRFGEFERRGDTSAGVPVAGRLRFMEIAVDANVRESLSWLRPEHADDQILASVLELQWAYPAKSITLVTEDRGLRTKARQAAVTTSPAPPPPTVAVKSRGSRRRRGAVIRVKSAKLVAQDRPAAPFFERNAPTSVLVVEVVNGGDETAFDVRGALLRRHAGGAWTYFGSLDIPVLEANGTLELRFPESGPQRPTVVRPRDVVIEEGMWTDRDGVEHVID
ncbi:PIN domain-containing protein [Miltoncostaea marina]|uniref:PIN domain-containing protein n=1 Tax=Miltoncostaea marina TaxID=2843215 RepID=UPI001C3DDBFA|nr:PIN domain-containing protein [Miltoncostaea marina]